MRRHSQHPPTLSQSELELLIEDELRAAAEVDPLSGACHVCGSHAGNKCVDITSPKKATDPLHVPYHPERVSSSIYHAARIMLYDRLYPILVDPPKESIIPEMEYSWFSALEDGDFDLAIPDDELCKDAYATDDPIAGEAVYCQHPLDHDDDHEGIVDEFTKVSWRRKQAPPETEDEEISISIIGSPSPIHVTTSPSPWVVSSGGGGSFVSSTPSHVAGSAMPGPGVSTVGDTWLDTGTGDVYVWDGKMWAPVAEPELATMPEPDPDSPAGLADVSGSTFTEAYSMFRNSWKRKTKTKDETTNDYSKLK